MVKRAAYLDIHDAVLGGYLQGRGEVKVEIDKVIVDGMRAGAGLINDRTGNLARNMRHVKVRPTGFLKGSGRIYNNLRYARWVDQGVLGPIFPVHGEYLAVPHRGISQTGVKGSELRKSHADGGPKQYSLRKSVSGQRAQNYIRKGYEIGLRKNGF